MYIDSGMEQIILPQCYNIQKIQTNLQSAADFLLAAGFFVLGLAENSCHEYTTLPKKETFKL
jgi:hypothetical protein